MASPTINPCLEAILWGRSDVRLPSNVARVEIRQAGFLMVPTGRIVACDPIVDFATPIAFTQETPKGHFPVRLAILHSDEAAGPFVAAAHLRFRDGFPDRWEMALRPREDLADLKLGEIFGYGVDSGTGCFMDRRAAKRLLARIERNDAYADEFIDQIQEGFADTRFSAMIDLDDVGSLNVAVFVSGAGDGHYASYWGWREDRLIALVTDFELLSDS